ncbi:peroxiredoxin Q/BCP [Litoreibacter ascidiaceicola]|uniref:thioredoxin-dependent peroxiredoxin n=1 Tax=Litoreibacter ascidiaceicola TaxID=1486859 RepID=A0A1M4VMX0_9RHOB|nr:thioredoxin-dependent thiol peroxidase [Litoreibacter ascidiaceicola]SHE70150.1 peroxiredoxin Q/BCP [Litoreibacter ascidiaceicola]
MTQIGELAPDFTLPRDGGDTVTLSTLQPSKVVLYFYPKDDTPGCTKQAIGFTEQLQAFKEAGCEVIGVSKDTAAKHDKFRDKHSLGVILASDAEGDVCKQYGVWKEKSMYGKTFMGIERSTFLIGSDGKILQEWRKVRVPGHVEAVLEAVQST